MKSFLSEFHKIQFFGRHRQRGGINDNSNVAQFLEGNQALKVINSIDLDITKGNTWESNRSSLPGKENLAPLPKRQRTKHTGIYICIYAVQFRNYNDFVCLIFM